MCLTVRPPTVRFDRSLYVVAPRFARVKLQECSMSTPVVLLRRSTPHLHAPFEARAPGDRTVTEWPLASSLIGTVLAERSDEAAPMRHRHHMAFAGSAALAVYEDEAASSSTSSS